MKRNETLLTGLVVPRFLRYVQVWTTSSRHGDRIPSTPGQWDLAKILEEELRGLGIEDVALTSQCYVIAHIPATPGKEGLPTVGFSAHLDTASDVSGKGVKPQLVTGYDGKKIVLADGYVLDPEEHADLAAHKGKDIIHTDGTTLLGADDKAGIAEIMGAVEFILTHPGIEHGPVELIFSPDEECGGGFSGFPLDTLHSKACYTLDGGAMGEVEIECFNAYAATVCFSGKVIHPGYARGILVNASLMAASFAVMLPRSESPEATDGYYGYYCPMEIQGSHETATLELIIRDFDQEGIRRRLDVLERFARAVEAQFPGGTITITSNPQYYNMKEKISAQPQVLEILKTAAANVGTAFRIKPIRGGTDGSQLTERGIPTPNIFTGGRNWHSRLEWASVSEMAAAADLVIELIHLWGQA